MKKLDEYTLRKIAKNGLIIRIKEKPEPENNVRGRKSIVRAEATIKSASLELPNKILHLNPEKVEFTIRNGLGQVGYSEIMNELINILTLGFILEDTDTLCGNGSVVVGKDMKISYFSGSFESSPVMMCFHGHYGNGINPHVEIEDAE